MNIADLQLKLEHLREEKQNFLQRMRTDGFNRSESIRLSEAILHTERELCALEGIEYAMASTVLPPKDAIQTDPCRLIVDDFSCALVYGRPNYGSCILFRRHSGVRLERINDEVLYGHPLYQRGLDTYRSHLIQNSQWLNSLKKIQSTHPEYSDKYWINVKHHLLFFKERIVEVLSSVEPDTYQFDSFDEATQFGFTQLR